MDNQVIKEHSFLSPSSANIWLNCSHHLHIKKERDDKRVIDDKGSVYATRGTKLHNVMEQLTKTGVVKGIPLDEGEKKHIAITLEGLKEIQDKTDKSKWVYEPQIRGRDRHGIEFFGTTDAYYLDDNNNLILVDYKFGRVEVKAEHNAQLLVYVLLLSEQLKIRFNDVSIYILQPYSKKPTKVAHYLDFFNSSLFRGLSTIIDEKVTAFVNGTATANVGSHCLYCPYKTQCDGFLGKVAQTSFELDFHKTEHKEQTYSLRSAFQKFFEELEADLIDKEPELKYHKVVDRQGHSEWNDIKQAEEFMLANGLSQENIFDKKIISPTKAKKLVKKDIEPLIKYKVIGKKLLKINKISAIEDK